MGRLKALTLKGENTMEIKEVIARLRKTTAVEDRRLGVILDLTGIDLVFLAKKEDFDDADDLEQYILKTLFNKMRPVPGTIKQEVTNILNPVYKYPIDIGVYTFNKEPVIKIVEKLIYTIETTDKIMPKLLKRIETLSKALGIKARDMIIGPSTRFISQKDAPKLQEAFDSIRGE